jgi:hypothetical protein
MLREIQKWLALRPNYDEVFFAIEEAKILMEKGHLSGTENLKSVLHWAFLGAQLPLDFVEQLIGLEMSRKPDDGRHD